MTKRNKQNGEWLLKEKREKLNLDNKRTIKSLKDLENIKLTLIENMRKNNLYGYDEELIDSKELEILISKTQFELIEYIPKKKMVFNINLLPINIYELDSYASFLESKREIMNLFKSQIEKLSEQWYGALVVFDICNELRNIDVDNYIYKPYIDAMVLSGLIKDDNCERLSVIQKGHYLNDCEGKKVLKIEIYHSIYLGEFSKEIMLNMIENFNAGTKEKSKKMVYTTFDLEL
ncbi:hypothetical protein [Clostridium baratii]|uniref:hypothetical protein n=1 Tax=Clostridium baratii TaxID=1561 RepID=UPI0005F2E23D|nr:hypothetical protein [Clostridium baratii]AQM58562.1 hypothetical protein NPD11_3088 [Clostridium baratii]KJU72405.1 hypothetical protein UC77_04550 [Clostridium baratii]